VDTDLRADEGVRHSVEALRNRLAQPFGRSLVSLMFGAPRDQVVSGLRGVRGVRGARHDLNNHDTSRRFYVEFEPQMANDIDNCRVVDERFSNCERGTIAHGPGVQRGEARSKDLLGKVPVRRQVPVARSNADHRDRFTDAPSSGFIWAIDGASEDGTGNSTS
jgi:hypothetical protein